MAMGLLNLKPLCTIAFEKTLLGERDRRLDQFIFIKMVDITVESNF